MNAKSIRVLIPGVFLAGAIAVTAYVIHPWLSVFGSVTTALLLGMLVGNICSPGDLFASGIGFSEKSILAFAIMLMGLELQLGDLFRLGPISGLIVIPAIVVTIGTSLVLGKLFGYSPGFSLILGVGNAVCGSSAIAAVAPATSAREDEIGISIGIVNLLGTLGMLLLPLLALKLGLSAKASSFLLGGSIQAVGQVVSAGFSLGSEIGEMATLVKMFRVIMIVPIVILVPFIFRKENSPSSSASRKGLIPGYLIGFLVSCSFVTLFGGDNQIVSMLKQLGKAALMVAMAGIGLKIRFADLLRQAPRALGLGVAVVLVQILTLLLLIFWLF
jgi:uncharacterized integral membrane protein (TIGR00698 family)